VTQLAEELNTYHECKEFTGAASMADLVSRHLERLLTDQIHE
jgi:hypothetical protein